MPTVYQKWHGLPVTKRSGVYFVTNTKNGKVYVGSATSIHSRVTSHRTYLNRGIHFSKHLQAAWNKYGEEAFKFDVLEVCKPHLLLEREQHWIDFFDAANPLNGYNKSIAAGYSMLGRNHSAESCAKMSKTRKGIVPVKATAAAAEANRGRERSAEVRAKISAGHKGKKKSAEHVANLAANHWSKGPNAAEITARMAASLRGKKATAETRKKLSEARTKFWAERRQEKTTQSAGTHESLFFATAPESAGISVPLEPCR